MDVKVELNYKISETLYEEKLINIKLFSNVWNLQWNLHVGLSDKRNIGSYL